MKKSTVETKIALTLTVIVIVFALVIGLIIVFGMGGELLSSVMDGFNGPDIEQVGSLFGLITVPVLVVGFLVYIIGGAGIFIVAIWIIWGIIKLIKRAINNKTKITSHEDMSDRKNIVQSKKMSNKKTIIVSFLCIIAITIFIVSFVNIDISTEKNYEYAKERTIGALAYNYCNEENIIYIKEFNKYEPYLVLHNNDYGEGKTLLLRKNVVGGYFETTENEYGKKIPNEYLHMKPYTRYENSAVDIYLQNDFQNRFDNDMLKIINNTEIGLCATKGSDFGLKRDEYCINRKFFVLSFDDIFEPKIIKKRYEEICNNSDNNKELKYFSKNRNNLIAFNDAGEQANWWVRNYHITYYYMIASGGYVNTGYEKAGIRPAFTINSSVNYKEVYDEEIGENIYILDI